MLVTSIPTLACRLNSAKFSEALTQHCGLPSPACAAVRGASIRGLPLDVYSNALSEMQTAGGHWNDHHGNIARFIVGQAHDNSLGAAYEPQHAYTDTLPRGARGVFSGLSCDGTDNGALGQRGITPDLRVRAAVGVKMHYDAKVVHVGTSTYPDTNGAAAARGAAVNTRARRVVSEYERHAWKIDAHSRTARERRRTTSARCSGDCSRSVSQASRSARSARRPTTPAACSRSSRSMAPRRAGPMPWPAARLPTARRSSP